ncbi:MAG: cobalt-precorrin-5B (C(1))-methyltransferase [Spirulina sp. SIO3F2]|nr:cobalt-precorrin-5B (C(1))-methyltransferase [Spirulina sp. SIO3F2]
MSQSGYTLPVFAAAAALAALRCLQTQQPPKTVELDLVEPPQRVAIPIAQVAPLDETQAIAITHSDPGENLDLTRDTPIWAWVQLNPDNSELITLQGGEGIGRQMNGHGVAAIYDYAKRVIVENLTPYCTTPITVTLILPEGRRLAQRTSNTAFGVVEGLSLLGTSGISQPLTAPEQLAAYRQDLSDRAGQFATAVFCVGENGLDLARRRGIPDAQLFKTANWLGPMLVTAALSGWSQILLLGYHGKLLKLAGGIFHTHHHLADGRLEILTTAAVRAGLPTDQIQPILDCATAEAALQYLRRLAPSTATSVYDQITAAIDRRAENYIHTHSEKNVTVGTALFGRDRQIFATSAQGQELLTGVLVYSE